jgi:hypothetical protein
METYFLTKDLSDGVKDVDTVKGIITGYFSTFNIKDSDGDIVMPGAYRKTSGRMADSERRGYYTFSSRLTDLSGSHIPERDKTGFN